MYFSDLILINKLYMKVSFTKSLLPGLSCIERDGRPGNLAGLLYLASFTCYGYARSNACDPSLFNFN